MAADGRTLREQRPHLVGRITSSRTPHQKETPMDATQLRPSSPRIPLLAALGCLLVAVPALIGVTRGPPAAAATGRSPATAASASTSPRPAAPTARRSSSTTATARTRSSGRSAHRRHDPRARQVHGRRGGRHRQRHQGAALRLQRHRRAEVDAPARTARWSTPARASASTPPGRARPTAHSCRSGPAPAAPTSSGRSRRAAATTPRAQPGRQDAGRALPVPGLGQPAEPATVMSATGVAGSPWRSSCPTAAATRCGTAAGR